MRDTSKAKAQRAAASIPAMIGVLAAKDGAIKGEVIASKINDMAELAALPIHAPNHGAEYGRSYVHFTTELLGEVAGAAVVEQLDKEGVIWRQVDQVRAAQKQIGRLRSDVVHNGGTEIPVDTLVYADETADFVGYSYRVIEHAVIPVKHSTGPTIRVNLSKTKHLDIPVGALRYVEAPMIRTR